MTIKVSGKLKWTLDPQKTLESLEVKIRKDILRKAVSKAAIPVRREVKAASPIRQGSLVPGGSLKASIGQRVRKGRIDTVALAVIGPRSSYVRHAGTFSRGKNVGKPRVIRPSKYSFLVEKGHAGPKPAAAHPFLLPAATRLAPQTIALMRATIGEEIKKVLK